MKKVIPTFSLLLLCLSVIGQNAIRLKNKTFVSNNLVQISPMSADRAVIFSDDFSVPSKWTINTPTGSGTMKDWVIGTTVPAGTFPLSPINSTTKANGYALFDSDLNCSSNQVANITTANPINCSANPFVRLQFQQQYRRFYDSTFVFISNNGSTWVKYPVNVNLGVNDVCPTNPEVVKVNISATAGGQTNVWIRFQYYSPSSLSSLAGCGYAWMIDDVSLTDINANDISLDGAHSDFSYEDGGYYSQTPKTQIVPITFRGIATNQGTAAQSNVKLNVKISNGASIVYNQNSAAIATLPYLASDSLFINSPAFTPPSAQATYTATFKVSQTQTELTGDTLNNLMVHSFKVTDTVYARDNGKKTGTTGPNFYTGGEEDGSEIANLFEFPIKATASSISVYIDTTTSLPTSIVAKIYKIDTISGAYTETAASAAYNITTVAQTNKWVTLPVAGDKRLDARTSYFASIATFGVSAGGPKVVIGSDEITKQPSGTSFVYLSTATSPDWGFISDLPMIRLNIVPGFVGINEVSHNEGIKLFQNQPNPFNKSSLITYELSKASKVSLEIYDITGRKLLSINQGNRVAGIHTITIDGKQFAPGVYSYSLNVNGTSVTKRMVITE